MNIYKILIPVFLVVLVVVGVWYLGGNTEDNKPPTKLEMIVYKAPACGCCVGYASESEKQNYNVKTVVTADMNEIKNRYKIPSEMESCHTAVIGDYFIEGHVPFEVVEKLLFEKPDIDGIALPNMPAGTPGMPGIKQGPYTIYQLVDGEYSEYITI